MNRFSSHRRSRAVAVCAAALTVGALSATSASAAPGFAFGARTGGLTRVETAVAASNVLYPKGGATDVVLVNLSATVDGLSASYLAGLKNAPILYTDTDAVPATTAAEIKRLGAKNIWIVGGTGVVSQSQQDGLAKNFTVTRFAGSDRYGTAAAVAQVSTLSATDDIYAPERIYITSGTSLADAVTVGPVAWAKNYAILLTKGTQVPSATSAALTKLGIGDRTVVGGTGVVSNPTYDALGATSRLGGATRQDTAVAVANDAVKTADFTAANVALVGGLDSNSVDALSASSIAGVTGTPILYIKGNDTVGPVTAAYLKANRTELTSASVGLVLGGTGAVSDKAVTEATAAAQ